MAVKFLDNTGLGYFWSKIKAWCNATFAAITHNQASDTIIAMTGYSKPNSGSAITVSDSLNDAIGKLEAKVDTVDQSNVVHRTGDETISGAKTFTDEIIGINKNNSTDDANDLYSTTVGSKLTYYTTANGSTTLTNIPAAINTTLESRTIRRISDSDWVVEQICHNSNGLYYRMGRGGTWDAWKTFAFTSDIPNISGKVDKSGDTMTGQLVIDRAAGSAGGSLRLKGNAINYAISIQDTGVTKGTAVSSTRYLGIDFYGSTYDSYTNRFGVLECQTTGTTSKLMMSAYNCTTATNTGNCTISVRVDASGNGFAEAPTPAADANDTRIATTAWVKARGFLTSHQSLSNYVDRSTTQEVSGNKKFMSGIERWGDNAHIKIFNTGLANNNTKPSSEKSSSLGLHANDGDTMASYGFVQYTDATTSRAAYIRCYVANSSTYRSVNLNAGGNNFFPGVTKQLTLGRSDRLWTTVYAQTGSINTSDEREKQAINSIPDNVLDVWEEISWKQFKLNDSVNEKGFDNARLHTGLIAQQIDNLFKSYNLDISRYGLFCYDEWGPSPAETNDDGEVVIDPLPAGNQYSLRYEEALCMEAAYQRRKNKILENRISELEKQVSDMLQILQNLTSSNG